MGATAGRGAPARLTASWPTAHALLTYREQTVAVITRGMKIRRRLRSVRVSALSEEERRRELREAEARGAHDHSDAPAESAASPRAAGKDGTPSPPEAGAERAGVSEPD